MPPDPREDPDVHSIPRSLRRLTVAAAGSDARDLAGGGRRRCRCPLPRGQRPLHRTAGAGRLHVAGRLLHRRPLHGRPVARHVQRRRDVVRHDRRLAGDRRVLFTTDTVADITAWGRRGTLTIKNAGAFHGAGPGEIVDLQTITGGTGGFAGATGALRASGTFDLARGIGTSSIEGTVCVR